MSCTPCEKTFAEVMTLLEMLGEETLTEPTQAKLKAVKVRVACTGLLLVDRRIRENRLAGRDTYREMG